MDWLGVLVAATLVTVALVGVYGWWIGLPFGVLVVVSWWLKQRRII